MQNKTNKWKQSHRNEGGNNKHEQCQRTAIREKGQETSRILLKPGWVALVAAIPRTMELTSFTLSSRALNKISLMVP